MYKHFICNRFFLNLYVKTMILTFCFFIYTIGECWEKLIIPDYLFLPFLSNKFIILLPSNSKFHFQPFPANFFQRSFKFPNSNTQGWGGLNNLLPISEIKGISYVLIIISHSSHISNDQPFLLRQYLRASLFNTLF